ncbi:hypothetical protein HDU86_006078 [Geranomyces michiganensis]|nr:hypothetical protein HDU86_006078 [Geranomyces michiganensis]
MPSAIVTGQWRTLHPIPVRTTGATLTYHSSTNSLYLLGGSRAVATASGIPSYKYSIDSGEWYLGPMQPSPPVSHAAAAYLGNDAIALHGGLRPLMDEEGVDEECMPANTVVLDAASDQFYSVPALPPTIARRRGHAVAVRGSSLLLSSGSNGRLLDDNATIFTSSLLAVLPTRAARDMSAAETWCARCDPFPDTVEEGHDNSYVLYIDEPYRDIHFTLSGADVSKLNLTVLSIQPVGSIFSSTGSLTIPVVSVYHMSAPYVLRVSYPAASTPVRRGDLPPVAHYAIAVTATTASGTGGGNDDPGSGLFISAQDVATFVVVFVASIIASLLATCAARRVRDRVHLVRLMRAGQVAALPRDPPAMYEVAVDMTGQGGARRGPNKSINLRERNAVLRSAVMDDLDSQISDIALPRRPVAVHLVGDSNPALVPSLATSFLMTFPGSSRAHPLTRLKVATAIYRDVTTTTAARKIVGIGASPRLTLWHRLVPLAVIDGWEFFRDVWRVERLLGLQA